MKFKNVVRSFIETELAEHENIIYETIEECVFSSTWFLLHLNVLNHLNYLNMSELFETIRTHFNVVFQEDYLSLTLIKYQTHKQVPISISTWSNR